MALSKSAASPRVAADLVMQATSAPNTFIFTELLETPQIQALSKSEEFAPYLSLLQIFSYGTYADYKSSPGLPELNEAQRLKLRQLSLLTLARKDAGAGSPALTYAALQEALDLPTRQALEELVISAVYAGLIKAQLNPKESVVQINSVAPLRDVAPTAVDSLLASLQAWSDRCDDTLAKLEREMQRVRDNANKRAAREAARAEETKKLIEAEQNGEDAPRLPPLFFEKKYTKAITVPGPATAAIASAASSAAGPSSTPAVASPSTMFPGPNPMDLPIRTKPGTAPADGDEASALSDKGPSSKWTKVLAIFKLKGKVEGQGWQPAA